MALTVTFNNKIIDLDPNYVSSALKLKMITKTSK